MGRQIDYGRRALRDRMKKHGTEPMGGKPDTRRQHVRPGKRYVDKYAGVTTPLTDDEVTRAREMARSRVDTREIARVLKKPVAMIRDALSNKPRGDQT